MLWTTIMISKKSTTFCNGVNKQVPEVWPLFAETGKARYKSLTKFWLFNWPLKRRLAPDRFRYLDLVFGWRIIHRILLDQLRSIILRVSNDFPKTWPRSESDFCSHLILTLPGRNISEKNEILGDKVPKSHVPLYFLYLDIIHANTRSKHYSKVFIGWYCSCWQHRN